MTKIISWTDAFRASLSLGYPEDGLQRNTTGDGERGVHQQL